MRYIILRLHGALRIIVVFAFKRARVRTELPVMIKALVKHRALCNSF
jgi:hypothetical protein